mmetsp:Transcript_14478/g.26025  ORF Transcript_14478/g.26025 Transcript_14478/m.26025 type:complete len:211 (-) Transcript_14478:982-1614(-)
MRTRTPDQYGGSFFAAGYVSSSSGHSASSSWSWASKHQLKASMTFQNTTKNASPSVRTSYPLYLRRSPRRMLSWREIASAIAILRFSHSLVELWTSVNTSAMLPVGASWFMYSFRSAVISPTPFLSLDGVATLPVRALWRLATHVFICCSVSAASLYSLSAFPTVNRYLKPVLTNSKPAGVLASVGCSTVAVTVDSCGISGMLPLSSVSK